MPWTSAGPRGVRLHGCAPGVRLSGQHACDPKGGRSPWEGFTRECPIKIDVLDDPGKLDAPAWNRLLAAQPHPTLFMRQEYLAALHASGSAVHATGWSPSFVTLRDGNRLVGACALYLKAHSWGEYVFDFAWAEAHERHGLAYYPKHVVAIPFTPVPGTRLMAVDDEARLQLAQALVELTRRRGLSSLHVLFTDATDAHALARAGCVQRDGVQFHWQRDPLAPSVDFEGLLASMQRDKRKKIRQEQRRVADAGVTYDVLDGTAIADADWRFFYECHTRTYALRGQLPYLSPAFFDGVARDMGGHWLMFVARQHGRRIAASLLAVDRAQRAAWGRYWGALVDLPCLHFDACYYQPLAWCLANGIDRFEGGAQGEHKMARGLLPQATRSMHWMADPRFLDAVHAAVGGESVGVQAYRRELERHTPFKRRP